MWAWTMLTQKDIRETNRNITQKNIKYIKIYLFKDI